MKKLLTILALGICMLFPTAAQAQTADVPVLRGNGIDTLRSIADKCDALEDTSTLTQKEFAFMITFTNQLLDAAEKADEEGTSDEFISENSSYLELLEGFAIILTVAESEGTLDSANLAGFNKLKQRIDVE